MGLDDFMEMGTEPEEEETTSSSDDDESPLEEYNNWEKDNSGNWTRYGPFGYESTEEYEDTVAGTLEQHGDLFKYNLPIFPHIEPRESDIVNAPFHEEGKRYSIKGVAHTVSCFSSGVVPLGTIPREIIMLDTGKVEKDKCMGVLKERLDTDPLPSLEVKLLYFAKTRQLVKMAIGDSMVNDWSIFMKRELEDAVFDEQATVPFREKDSGGHDVKGVTQIEPW